MLKMLNTKHGIYLNLNGNTTYKSIIIEKNCIIHKNYYFYNLLIFYIINLKL